MLKNNEAGCMCGLGLCVYGVPFMCHGGISIAMRWRFVSTYCLFIGEVYLDCMYQNSVKEYDVQGSFKSVEGGFVTERTLERRLLKNPVDGMQGLKTITKLHWKVDIIVSVANETIQNGICRLTNLRTLFCIFDSKFQNLMTLRYDKYYLISICLLKCLVYSLVIWIKYICWICNWLKGVFSIHVSDHILEKIVEMKGDEMVMNSVWYETPESLMVLPLFENLTWSIHMDYKESVWLNSCSHTSMYNFVMELLMCLICDSLYVIEFTKIKVVVGSWLARSFANSGEILRNKQDDLRWVPRGGWDCVIIFLLSLVVVNKILCLVASAFRLDDAWPSYCVLVILEAYYCFQYIFSSLGSRECMY